MPSITGTVTQDGVTSSSNTLTADEMRAELGITPETDAPEPEPETPAERPAEPAPPETPAPAEPAAKRKDPTKDPAARIAKATYEREQAKREAQAEIQRVRDESQRELAALRAEMQTLRAPKAEPETPKADAEPQLEQFADQPDPYAAWLRAMARYDLKQEMTARERQQADDRRAYVASQAQQQRDQAELERLAEFGEKLSTAFAAQPDLEARMATTQIRISRPMQDAIVESDAPDALCAYLLDHPDEVTRILKLNTPLKQFRAMTRIETTLDAAAPPGRPETPQLKTTAHAPIRPVGGGHAAPASGPPGDDATYEEHEAYWNAQERQAKTAGARR